MQFLILVIDVLDSRKRYYRLKYASNASLPLRGFLICPEMECGHLLTGSASKGRNKYYAYYHCSAGCKNPKKPCRVRAEFINELFLQELKRYIPQADWVEVYKHTIVELWSEQATQQPDEHKKILNKIKELQGRLTYSMELLSCKQIEPVDYRQISTDIKARLEKLEIKFSILKEDRTDIGSLLSAGISSLLKLDVIYEMGGIEKKREVINSIFPEKLSFTKYGDRTGRLNEAVRLIYTLDKGFRKEKSTRSGSKTTLCRQVRKRRFELPSP
ncbi:zinc ribbon domain-containing protein [Arachidicoccus sp.]|uniref:zinc ribbon domain-containing protein n=1 Tax=Arachidicoccus sp. TaxID=1872624 RepID=UPI003D1E1E23